MAQSSFGNNLEDQNIELNLYKIGAIVLIISLGITTLYFSQRSGNMAAAVDKARSQLAETKTELEQVRQELEQKNQTLNFVQQRNSEIKVENGQLRMIADRPLVKADYQARNSSNGLNVQIDVANYGNITARDIQGTCRLYREGADGSYSSFGFSVDKLANRTVRTVSTQPGISEQPRTSDMISCRITTCQGLCQPLHKRIDRFYTQHPRTEFN
ncbi:MAG: hypothetical protein ABEK10_04975 [Candidatus Nanosalina sp.]